MTTKRQRSPGSVALPGARGFSGRRSGIVFAWLCISLVGLILAVGASVEVGKLTVIRGKMQHAADLSALAGVVVGHDETSEEAWHLAANLYRDNLTGGTTNVSVALVEYLNEAGVSPSPNGAVFMVGDTTLRVRHPYRDAKTDALGWPAEQLFEVRTERRVKTPLFGPVGMDNALVRTRAVAFLDIDKSGQMAVFAREDGPAAQAFTWTGSGGVIGGYVHSNSGVKIGGSDHRVTGHVAYVTGQTVTGTGTTVEEGFRQSYVRDYPFRLTADTFGTPDYVVNGKLTVTRSNTVMRPGYYRVHGDVSISSTGLVAEGVTIVADGVITVSATDSTFTPALLDTVFVSLDNRRPYSISVSASGGSVTGLIFSPFGVVKYTGTDHNVVEGALVGEEVQISGTDFTLQPKDGEWNNGRAKLVQ